MISIAQCRGARALLGWSAQELADQAGIGVATVRRFESASSIAASSIDAMASALTTAGITFISAGKASPAGGEGVRLAVPATLT
ncbi:helix-turn-helix transcriptional regulator [Sphingomonas aurantiaca]|uniref:helix-turn-helix transcriptional regulator n=1 Tax=Sphingomonas aurantiaca TaxID=185949 RepID=UPI002FE35B3A